MYGIPVGDSNAEYIRGKMTLAPPSSNLDGVVDREVVRDRAGVITHAPRLVSEVFSQQGGGQNSDEDGGG
jgi:hypothetical protein